MKNMEHMLQPTSENIDDKNLLTDENFNYKGATKAGITIAAVLASANISAQETYVPQVEVIAESSVNNLETNNQYPSKIATYRIAYGELTDDQVLFYDQNGIPIGGPVMLLPIIKKEFESIKIILPGVTSSAGKLVGGINTKWLDQKRTEICEQNKTVTCDLALGLPEQINMLPSLREARVWAEGQGISVPKTHMEYVYTKANQKVAEPDIDDTYINYISRYFLENVELDKDLENELRKYILGLTAQESSFNVNAKSSAGAKGLMQFMPDTWKSYGLGPNETTKVSKQVQAAGKYFKDVDTYFTENSKDALDKIQVDYFGGDTVAFKKYFYTPLLINSFNAGQGRMKKIVNWFALQKVENKDSGFAVFLRMAEMAKEDATQDTRGYEKHASEYVPRIIAFSSLFEEEMKKNNKIN